MSDSPSYESIGNPCAERSSRTLRIRQWMAHHAVQVVVELPGGFTVSEHPAFVKAAMETVADRIAVCIDQGARAVIMFDALPQQDEAELMPDETEAYLQARQIVQAMGLAEGNIVECTIRFQEDDEVLPAGTQLMPD